MPDLGDPNFFRSLVLLCSHDEEGAFGIVINSPSAITVADVCGQIDVAWQGDEDILARIGGPVQPVMAGLFTVGKRHSGQSENRTRLYISSSLDALQGTRNNRRGLCRVPWLRRLGSRAIGK